MSAEKRIATHVSRNDMEVDDDKKIGKCVYLVSRYVKE